MSGYGSPLIAWRYPARFYGRGCAQNGAIDAFLKMKEME